MEELVNLSDGYFLLAIAIVTQAADDYRMAYRRFLKTGIKNQTMLEIEHWLLHDIGSILALNRGEYILRTIRKEEDAKRRPKKATWGKKITYGGKSLTLREWSEETGINIKTLRNRLRAGWAIEDVLTRQPHREIQR